MPSLAWTPLPATLHEISGLAGISVEAVLHSPLTAKRRFFGILALAEGVVSPKCAKEPYKMGNLPQIKKLVLQLL
uniref:Uncharacterized protein n=1 Tax=Magnetococcus massalia (strain MO-1) TaxID=451514 RepID=A0A1S7LFE9_MAGMO|nr:Protein of unknown function [Candidatus Magnetococcus massalia]